MKKYELKFEGYTWDEYFYVIGNKSGILVAYRGGLDSEGAIKLEDIVYIDEADKLSLSYESSYIKDIRKRLDNCRLFFSYAEMKNDGREDVVKELKRYLLPINNEKSVLPQMKLLCKGACSLFPKELLQEK